MIFVISAINLEEFCLISVIFMWLPGVEKLVEFDNAVGTGLKLDLDFDTPYGHYFEAETVDDNTEAVIDSELIDIEVVDKREPKLMGKNFANNPVDGQGMLVEEQAVRLLYL